MSGNAVSEPGVNGAMNMMGLLRFLAPAKLELGRGFGGGFSGNVFQLQELTVLTNDVSGEGEVRNRGQLHQGDQGRGRESAEPSLADA